MASRTMSFTSLVSGLPSLPQPVAVVCHDAGAANLILAEMNAFPNVQCLPVMQGPAQALWLASNSAAIPILSLENALFQAASVLTGTSWASDLEHQARLLARDKGLPSITALDHWVNYSERFERDGNAVQPDEIWVTDSYAFDLASNVFTGTTVREITNRYLHNQVKDIAAFGPPLNKNAVLYVLEPLRFTWPGCTQAGEFEALDFFVANLAKLPNPLTAQIRLRPHPSDAIGKYDAWLLANAHLNIALDHCDSLAQAIGEAQWVAGCESMALIVALAAGRKTIATLPPAAPACRLPHNALIHLRDLK